MAQAAIAKAKDLATDTPAGSVVDEVRLGGGRQSEMLHPGFL